jgi:endonuclease/exonuclease/phosphatase family metal-dependent hydrolase
VVEAVPLQFCVMTYNVGNGLAKPERLVPLLQSSSADLICLQELTDQQAEAIREGLQGDYPNQVLFPGGFEGQGVLSRFPIRAAEQLHLYPARPDLKCVVEIEDRSLTVIAAHPPPPRLRKLGFHFDAQAKAQISELIRMAHSNPPAILLGDLNTVAGTPTYVELHQAGLKDAYRSGGDGAGHTLPTRLGPWRRLQKINRLLRWMPMLPFLRVDYIWHTDPLTTIAAWVGGDAGSDHLPVLARLALGTGSDQIKGNPTDPHKRG